MTISQASQQLARLLAQHQCRVVFAESCTAGLVAASLGRIPGISNYLCGSMVTYRTEEKAAWLGISAKLLRNPGPVSEIVARKMADEVLQRTTEAHLSAAVTGHLGPNAPEELDGVVYFATAMRGRGTKATRLQCAVTKYQCCAKTRAARQREVAEQVLLAVCQRLQRHDG